MNSRCPHEAGLGPAALQSWLADVFPGELESMPFVGRYHEMLYQRLRNADDKWTANDLVDMHYLACAAGYADVVVGEKKMSELLVRAERTLPGGAHVCRTLPAAAAHLEIVLKGNTRRGGTDG